jgi:hypothetical protein
VAIGALTLALGTGTAEAKFPAGLVFAHKRTATVEWLDLQKAGRRFQLCNTNDADTRVTPVFDGFRFVRDRQPVDDDAEILYVKGAPDSRALIAGDCLPVTLVARRGSRIDAGSYSGTFAVVGKGAGIARVRVTVVRGAAKGTTAETHVSLERAQYGGLHIAETVDLHMPRGTPGLREVLLSESGQNRQDALNSLLGRVGLPYVYYSRYGPRATLSLDDTRATLTIPQDRDLYSFDSGALDRDNTLGAGEVRLSRARDDRMRLDLAGPEPDAGTAWVAEVSVAASDQEHFEPPPELRRGDLLRWSFPAGAKGATPSVTFELDDEIERKLLLGNEFPQALRAVTFVGTEALLAALLLLLLWRDEREGSSRKRLRLVAWAAILLLLGMLTVWLIQTFVLGVRWRNSEESELGQFFQLFGQIGAPLLGAAVLVSIARNPDSPLNRRALLLVSGALLIAAVSMFAVASRSFGDPHPGVLEHHPVRWLLAASGPLLAFLLCLLVLGASAQIVRRSWPAGAVRRRADKISHRWVWLAVGGLSAVAAAQWTRGVKARYDQYPLEVDGKAIAWWDSLAGDIGFFPLGMLGRLLDILPVLLVVAALPLLQHYAGTGASEMSFRERDRPIRLLILIFAGVVAGTAGQLEGFRLPLTFVLAYVFLRILVRDRDDGAGSAKLPRGERRIRTTRALRREELRRNQRKLYGELVAGDKTLDAYRKSLNRLQRLPVDTDPLSRGVFDDWWKNATTAARLGAYLSVVPIAYYIGVIVFDRIDDDLSRTAEFGVLDLLVGLSAEGATWIVAAFVLGGLYAHLPSRQGPAKGALLGIAFAASLGLGAEVLPDGDSTWVFRSLEMFLFLGVLGFWIDRRTVEEQGFYWRELFDLYHLRETRFAATYGSTLGLALLGVFQQLVSGDASQTVTALLEAVGGALPDPTG